MKRYNHIQLPNTILTTMKYSPTQKGGSKYQLKERDKTGHAKYLENKYNKVLEELKKNQEKLNLDFTDYSNKLGCYMEFSSDWGYDLITSGLEDQKQGIRLLNIRTLTNKDNETKTFGTIFIPNGKERWFLKKIKDYLTKNNKKNNTPRHDKLIRSIEDIQLALFKSLWTDNTKYFPNNDEVDWFEIWINIEERTKQKDISRFANLLEKLQIQYKKDAYIVFPERVVFLVYSNKSTLSSLLFYSDQLAEYRKGRELAGFICSEHLSKQQLWLEDILKRIKIDSKSDTNSVVCLLDSGVNNGHPLLKPFISDKECSYVINDPKSAIHDTTGHGTEMCGTILYGDLTPYFSNTDTINIDYNIASIKIYSKTAHQKEQNKENWGFLTQEAVYIGQSIYPNKDITYCMAVTADDESIDGTPSSWSGAIDKLIYNDGRDGLLFLVSAGNITDYNSTNKLIIDGYPNNNNLRNIEDPGQSWNALTVGAYTNKLALGSTEQELLEADRVAPKGGISPFSRTSGQWAKKSLIKPEVMFEGGNLYKTKHQTPPYLDHEDLSLITTSHDFQKYYFSAFSGTSAATALAGRLAGKLQKKYPNLWAESIRGLIVHSATWTEEMIKQFPANNKTDLLNRLRNCGYGVPSEEKALYSSENNLTYISQAIIQPYKIEKDNDSPKINEMHLYDLPWPKDELLQLADIPITMKITLSYFIEPAPGERGWKDKYRYASCGLRFTLNSSTEDKKSFLKRINKLSQDEKETNSDSSNIKWVIGKNRDKGSIHSDEFTTIASELATCSYIAIFPVGGWWKTRKNLNCWNKKIRYSLIVSIITPKIDIDLYNIIQQKLSIETPITISTSNNL